MGNKENENKSIDEEMLSVLREKREEYSENSEWDSLLHLKRRELLIEKAAELYDLQRKLNKCIGRTFYDSLVKDSALLWHIKDEIVYRFPFIQEDFDHMGKEGFDYPEETFKKYINIYKKSYNPNVDLSSRDSTNFVKKVRNCFLMHKEKGGHFIKDEKTFWHRAGLRGRAGKSGTGVFRAKLPVRCGRGFPRAFRPP